MNTLPATVATPAPTFTMAAYEAKDLQQAIGLPAAERELRAAIADYDKHLTGTVQAAIRIGHAAATAKALCDEGTFTKWLTATFPDFSVQWARRCMQAAESYLQLQQDCANEADRETIMARMTSVERMAALGGILRGKDVGESPLSAVIAATPAKPTGRPAKAKLNLTKAAPAPKGAPVLDGAQAKRSAAELLEWEDELQQREERIAARERELDDLQHELEELKAKLTMAATKGDVIDVEAKTPTVEDLYEGAEKPKWPDTPAQKAAATSGKPRTSRAKGKGKGTPAPQAENGSDNEVL